MKSLVSAAFAALLALCLGACASNGGASAAGGGTPVGGTGIQMFGVIDAGVSHTTTKSAPVAPR